MRYIPRGEPLTPPPELGVDEVNKSLEGKDAEEVVKWAVDRFGSDRLVVTTSFGIQSAVMLHMVSEIVPNVTVVWVDTGYFPPETYRYAEQLCDRLQIRLKIYQSELSPARMEAIYGKLWDNQDIESLKLYNRIRKVEPLHRAFNELQCQVWLTGVRRSQTEKRATLSTFDVVDSRAKVRSYQWNVDPSPYIVGKSNKF